MRRALDAFLNFPEGVAMADEFVNRECAAKYKIRGLFL